MWPEIKLIVDKDGPPFIVMTLEDGRKKALDLRGADKLAAELRIVAEAGEKIVNDRFLVTRRESEVSDGGRNSV